MMKVHDDFEQMGDLDGSPLRVGGQIVPVGIERGLVDLPQITATVPGSWKTSSALAVHLLSTPPASSGTWNARTGYGARSI